MKSNVPIIGLAGGIAAGKSTVARAFESLNCLIVDSDRLNHQILNRPSVLETLESWWGRRVRRADGTADRRFIAGKVFSAESERRRLEALTHPLIAQERAAIIQQASVDSTVQAVILDSPLLFESNLNELCDGVVFVDVPRALRLQRVRESRGWDESELRRREQQQWPVERKRVHSDFIVDGATEPGALLVELQGILESLRKRHDKSESF